MRNYHYVISNGHHLAELDGKLFIIDTGSPVSFSMRDGLSEVCINGECFPLSAPPMQLDPQRVSGLVGIEADGFIGMDLLRRLGSVTFDRKNGRVFFGNGEFEAKVRTPLQIFELFGNAVPLMDAEINGRRAHAILDTGACVGYVASALTEGAEPVGIVHDYNPMFGDISGEKYNMTLSCGGVEFATQFVKMPMMIEMSLVFMQGVNAFVGLNNFTADAIRLDFGHKFFELQ